MYVVYECSYRRIHLYTKERSKAVYAVSLETNQYKLSRHTQELALFYKKCSCLF